MVTTVRDGEIPRDMVDGIALFGQRAHACVDRLVRRLNRAKRPRLIYHYTNDAGLIGIVEKGELWFTDAGFLNDPSELDHGVMVSSRRFGE